MPFGSTRVIPDGWEERHRPIAKGQMLAEIAFVRPSVDGVFDEATATTTKAAPTALWSGPCRIRYTPPSDTATTGERQVPAGITTVIVPTDTPEIRSGDTGTVTACDTNPELVGKTLRVTSARVASVSWQRELTVTVQEPMNR